MDNLTAIRFSGETKSKLHCLRKGLAKMMDGTLPVTVEHIRITTYIRLVNSQLKVNLKSQLRMRETHTD